MIGKLIAFITRKIPMMSGCGHLAHNKFPTPTGSSTPRWMKLRTGESILASVHEYVGRVVYYFGELDPKVFWVAKKFVTKGDTVLDLGGNIGVFALPCANLVGKTGFVHTWEPQPELVSQLKEAKIKNKLDQLTIHPEALGENNEDLTLHISEYNLGGASLIEHREECDSSIKVPVRHSGERFQELDLKEIAMVKMDVEGFETSVIKGTFNFWKTYPPKVILFEYREETPFFESKINNLLTKLGYSFYCLPSTFFNCSLLPLEKKPNNLRTSHDLVALHHSISPK